MRLWITFLAVVFIGSGCIPMRRHDTPQVTGAVYDAVSSQPIAGARLYYADFPDHEVYTDADGRFDIPGISHWGFLVLLPIDRLPPHSILSAEASGYATTNASLFGWYGSTSRVFYMVRH